jgi:hypothetical protein
VSPKEIRQATGLHTVHTVSKAERPTATGLDDNHTVEGSDLSECDLLVSSVQARKNRG